MRQIKNRSLNHSESSSKGFWNALAGGWSIFDLAANRRVAGPRVFRTFGTGIRGGGPVDPGVPNPALPSLLTRGTCNKEKFIQRASFMWRNNFFSPPIFFNLELTG